MAAASQVLTDHDEIRRWAEVRNGRPACVRGTGGGGDVGMIRLDFPGFTEGESLESITWDEWFRAFDENNLALLVQERTDDGQLSNFNKLVDRNTAVRGERARPTARSSRARSAAGGRARKSSAARAARKTAGSRKTSRGGARKTAARRKTGSRSRAKGSARKGARGATAKRR